MALPEGLIQPGTDGLYLRVHAQPGAKKTSLRGLHGDALKIAVKEAPEAGKANRAIEAFVAEALGLAKASVIVTSGHTSRCKRLFIDGDVALLTAKVNHWLAAS